MTFLCKRYVFGSLRYLLLLAACTLLCVAVFEKVELFTRRTTSSSEEDGVQQPDKTDIGNAADIFSESDETLSNASSNSLEQLSTYSSDSIGGEEETNNQLAKNNVRKEQKSGSRKKKDEQYFEGDHVEFDDITTPVPNDLVTDTMPENDDAKRRLRFIYKKMRSYLKALRGIRNRYLRYSFPTQADICTDRLVKRTASGKFADHFERFRKYLPKSSTLILKTTSDIFGEGLLDRYYHPSSNDCALMQGKTRVGKIQDYGCDTDIEKTFEPISVEPIDFQSVLPIHFRAVIVKPDRVRLIYIHIIAGGVVTELGDVISENGVVQVRRCDKPDADHSNRCPSVEELHKVDEVFVIDAFPVKNFYHTNAEGVARLTPYLRFLRQNPQIKIHAPAYFTFLPLLGLTKDRLVSGTVVGRVVYLPSGSTCNSIGLMTGQLLSLNLRLNLANMDLPRDTIIIIKRSSRRYFKYHEQIHAMLKSYADRLGLNVWVFTDNPLPSLNQTRQMFYRALIVIAPHGAGQANMLFSQPGTILMEGLCPYNVDREGSRTFWNLGYASIMKRLGMRYYGMAYQHYCHLVNVEQVEKPFVRYLRLLGYDP